MLTALVAATCVALIGVLRGASFRSLAETTFRWTPILFVGLVMQIGFGYWSPPWVDEVALPIILVSNLAVIAFLLVNRRLPGLALAGVGVLLNLVVIGLNGAMPVLEPAAEKAGISRSLDDPGIKHERLEEDTVLPWLADVIPVPPFKEVLSLGDVVLGLGLCYLVHARMGSRAPPRHRAAAGARRGTEEST